METLKDLRSWASNIGKFGGMDEIENVEGSIFCHTESDKDFGEIRFRIYTNDNSYSIVAHCTPQKSYLGCIARSRKPRAGETWTRGNDLADGKLNYKTWVRILGDIVSYELVQVHGPRIETPDVEESPVIGPNKE